MAKFHVQGHRKLYIHNTLDQGADNARSDIEKKLKDGDRTGIGFDYMTCGIMLAFTFEAQVNFMGTRFCTPWSYFGVWKAKVETVFNALKMEYDWAKRPFISAQKMKVFRDTLAHGKPVDENLNEDFEAATMEEARAKYNFKQAWEAMMTHEEIMQAYDDNQQVWKMMLEKSGINIMDTLDQMNLTIHAINPPLQG
ncbi:hypothetical protein [Bradyrhizobium sp. OK095]|uniref:hypothetical protein n=1 Tax=Bradyrhizobium sp. OK095 TaxID=1882760 RepID=UPI0008B949C4|nr:hypothetical protein [Bradyrhizobium sp. OK095]SEO09034.1 hypothetical protein SAMN05443254_117143 [Bradyrhizobium sp. OK095]